MNLLMRAAKCVGGLIRDALDPVCQDKSAVIYGWHKRVSVRLRPIIGSDGRVTDWVPDPDDVALIDAEEASRAAVAATASSSAPPSLPPALPGTPSGGFNPATIPGL